MWHGNRVHVFADGRLGVASRRSGRQTHPSIVAIAAAIRNVKVRPRAGLDELNEALADAAAYGGIQRSQVDAWRQPRNDADHGHFDRYSLQEVRLMVAGVQTLLTGLN